ncbi:hypothetical protein BG006_007640 [Podila minutissima]|uniref:Nuclear cap-binding protein subunit 3 n=1 Tax=Podila minutissima TaxID=64525 RepID=A0A9P5VKI8_9FUNG|nr:hypothetical protein BG006_007640 [Podila minutissima]
MDTDADQYVLTAEDELDLDLALSTEANIVGNGANYRDSMLELEQALEEETRDITDRFNNERRPEPTGLDRALGSSNYRSHQREGHEQPPKYANKSGGFITGFDPLSKEERQKKASRAQRFGAVIQREVKEQAMDEGSGMDVDEGDWKRPTDLPDTPPRTSMIRLDAVHLYGTNEMSTKDVLKYFEAYGPSHVEWIDDSSCNVVFKDNYSAKRALYNQLVDEEANFGEDEDEEGALVDVEPGRPQGDGTTSSVLYAKSNNRLQRAKEYIPVQQHNQPVIQNNKGLYLRYATDFDVKERGAAARSTYYQIHGREENKRKTGSSNSRHSSSQHQYGRRSRADEDEVWARGRDRGIQTLSSLRRKMERGSESPSPSRRSWSRNRLLAGSRSRSRSSSRGRRSDRSRSPGYNSLRDRASRSPDSGRLRSDDYGNRGRRGDISLRLGGRVTQPEETSLNLAVENRINDLADDFLTELESTFTRREKTIPKTRTLYSDFYEKEYMTEGPTKSRTNEGFERRPISGDRDRDDYRRRDYSPRRSHGGGGGGRREKSHGSRDKAEALKAVEARLGLSASIDARLGKTKNEPEEVDEFGRTWRKD